MVVARSGIQIIQNEFGAVVNEEKPHVAVIGYELKLTARHRAFQTEFNRVFFRIILNDACGIFSERRGDGNRLAVVIGGIKIQLFIGTLDQCHLFTEMIFQFPFKADALHINIQMSRSNQRFIINF